MKTYQELCVMNLEQLYEQPCGCLMCSTCGGVGTIKVNARGQYITYYDDCYDLEPCFQCIGGIDESCHRCNLIEEMEIDATEK